MGRERGKWDGRCHGARVGTSHDRFVATLWIFFLSDCTSMRAPTHAHLTSSTHDHFLRPVLHTHGPHVVLCAHCIQQHLAEIPVIADTSVVPCRVEHRCPHTWPRLCRGHNAACIAALIDRPFPRYSEQDDLHSWTKQWKRNWAAMGRRSKSKGAKASVLSGTHLWLEKGANVRMQSLNEQSKAF